MGRAKGHGVAGGGGHVDDLTPEDSGGGLPRPCAY